MKIPASVATLINRFFPETITVNSTQPALTLNQSGSGGALKIVNLGTGYSLLIEDSASPDVTPVIVDNTGRLGVGTLTPGQLLDIFGGNVRQQRDASTNQYIMNVAASFNRVLLRRSSGTIAVPTIVANGDTISDWLAQGYDGAAFQNLGAMAFTVDGVPGAGDMPGRWTLSLSPDGTNVMVERIRTDNAGLITGTGPSLGAWTSYTPVLGGTGWAIGDGTITGQYCQIGKDIFYRIAITFGAASTYGLVAPTITVPVAAPTAASLDQCVTSSLATMRDASTGNNYSVAIRAISTTAITLQTIGVLGLQADVTNLSPIALAAGDTIRTSGQYEGA